MLRRAGECCGVVTRNVADGSMELFQAKSVILACGGFQGDGGMMREQVCTYMCPWPRIQAAMTDSEALCVTYRRDRGEPDQSETAWRQPHSGDHRHR